MTEVSSSAEVDVLRGKHLLLIILLFCLFDQSDDRKLIASYFAN